MAQRADNSRMYATARKSYEHYIARAEANPKDNGLYYNPEVIALWPRGSLRKNNIKIFLTQGTVVKKNIDKHNKLLHAYSTSKTAVTG